jgi:hypothetical protein
MVFSSVQSAREASTPTHEPDARRVLPPFIHVKRKIVRSPDTTFSNSLSFNKFGAAGDLHDDAAGAAPARGPA